MPIDLATTAVVAVAAFASTNVDNLLATSAQVAVARPERVRRVLYGQAAGTVIVAAVATAVATVVFDVPDRWVGLLGLVPLLLGARDLLALRQAERRAGRPPRSMGRGFVAALVVAVSLSGDNFAVYVPVLRHVRAEGKAVTLGVFAALEVVLCLVALATGRHPAARRAIDRTGAFAAPVLYLVIGVVVLLRSGTFGHP